MENITLQLREWAVMYGTKIIGAAIILIIGRFLAGILTHFVKRLMRKSKADETLTGFVSSFTKISILAFVAMAALGALGVHTASMIAVMAAAGLAVGFALQSSLSNFASGIMLIIFRPFQTGHYIQAGGASGTVEEIRLFNTVLRSPDNIRIIMPNSKITGDKITNYSVKETRRIDLKFSVGYQDDLKLAREIIERVISEDERILKDPKPDVRVVELSDNSVDFAVRPWVKASDNWPTRCDLIEKIKREFDAKGISIPFPLRDIHLYQATG